ncbi:MAG: methyltransferase [Methylotenera sp.]|nr:methyltransferase [Oligoflexia bacterium]
MVKIQLETPFKAGLQLRRYPVNKNETLQAWDSADELLLEHLAQQGPDALKGKRILIINDQFGALSCALQGFEMTTYTDSYVAARAMELNSRGAVKPIHDLKELSGKYDLVLIKLPKNASFFEDCLAHLTKHLSSGSQVISASMVKHMAKASFDHLQKYIGTTTTSLAEKKARLIFAPFQKGPVDSPYPIHVEMDSFEVKFVNHSNLFSRERLDIGTRFLLENIPAGDFKTILDLGCGNGILGIQARKRNPLAKIIFSDESAMALQSAKINFERQFPESAASAEYHWTNCFEDQTPDSVDLVLCNPPFHQQNTIGDFIAWQMFTDAQKAMKVGGLIRVIGNLHLGYDAKLKRIFGNSKVAASNPKFMIIDSKKYK